MNGYRSHTFQWVKAKDERCWVKFHFKTNQGIKCFTSEEAAIVGGKDQQYCQHDLYETIERGAFPSWTLLVQVMPEADAATYRIDPFDLTKVWPHKDYPPVAIGTLVLNRVPDNYFAEVEQAAFDPSHFVDGIGPSPDRMLQTRFFAYQRQEVLARNHGALVAGDGAHGPEGVQVVVLDVHPGCRGHERQPRRGATLPPAATLAGAGEDVARRRAGVRAPDVTRLTARRLGAIGTAPITGCGAAAASGVPEHGPVPPAHPTVAGSYH
jgi:hypothetical protein